VDQNDEQEQVEHKVVNHIPAVSEVEDEDDDDDDDDDDEDDSSETAGVQEKKPNNQPLVERVDQERVDNEMNEQYGNRQRQGLRTRQPRNYFHRYSEEDHAMAQHEVMKPMDYHHQHAELEYIAMTQYSV
jgi:hypothetical protein